MFRRPERYQLALIFLGLISTALLGRFIYRELFPEYRIYQNDYIALEKFRSTYTGELPPNFAPGVKQIVFEREDKGPARIDRCTSCHVAEQLPHFSPTKIAFDVNGNMIRDADGTPVKVPNEDYVWGKLDQKIRELTDEKVIEQLKGQVGGEAVVKARLDEAERLKALKTAKVGDQIYDVTKVLSMHPLIGKETRPFEFHNIDDYGCTICHSGNGRGLTTDKAHGPVYDGQYEIENEGPEPEFTERDEHNDPDFARVFNHKPSDSLLFQTTPILVDNLIQSSCIQCHEQSAKALQGLAETAGSLASKRYKNIDAMKLAFANEKSALLSLVGLNLQLKKLGYEGTLQSIQKELDNPAILTREHERLSSQLAFIKNHKSKKEAQDAINSALTAMLGSSLLVESLENDLKQKTDDKEVDNFLKEHLNEKDAKGSLFKKWEVNGLEASILSHIEDTQLSFERASKDQQSISSMASDIDALTKDFHRGQQLYISQACYACHKIAGTARGGVGPELTRAGENYPWYLKKHIVWPQGELKTSTMPNFRLDNLELEDLMTYLLAQKGPTKTVSETEYKISVQEWEAGRKMPWEKPLSPSQVHDLRYAMTVFATEGCASCHRLEGFESNVGYAVEKDPKADFDKRYAESQWFQALFPEEAHGSAIVAAIEKNEIDIDRRIVNDVRSDSFLEEIEKNHPDTIEAFYSNFRYAARAKDDHYKKLLNNAKSASEKNQALEQLKRWQERVHRVLMIYVQEYGLGRLIGPRPNWSGVFRSDEWLMEHFHNPAGHVPHSIMPIMPFDDSKFYALTYMLDTVGKRNRDKVRSIWNHNGFNPGQAFQIHCAQCHGDYLQGNGPVSTWIYPIPKNLRGVEFLRNLTKQNAIVSIEHGVKGTPMPPWGEAPRDKQNYDGIPVLSSEEIRKLVDWLYTSLPGSAAVRGIQEIPKWYYTPKDVIEELHREGGELKSETEDREESGQPPKKNIKMLGAVDGFDIPLELRSLPNGDGYYASLDPKVTAKIADDDVSNIFDIEPNTDPTEQPNSYFIKKKFYTEENIESGRRFFEINCAVCHGTEADGSGVRASVMLDAKPRMLTNLDWIKTRDDLRLLRSIKYGVPGTAMTPWGDLTSSLQRLQLVIFIRSLSHEKDRRETLAESLYNTFDMADLQIEKARFNEYAAIEKLQKKQDEIKKDRLQVSQPDNATIQHAVDLYRQQLEEETFSRQLQKIDQSLKDLRELNARQRSIYLSIGNDMLSGGVSEEIWQNYLKIVRLQGEQFRIENDQLVMMVAQDEKSEIFKLSEQIVAALDENTKEAENQKTIIAGKLPSNDRDAQMHDLAAQIEKNGKIKKKLLSGLAEASTIRKEELKMFKDYLSSKDAVINQR